MFVLTTNIGTDSGCLNEPYALISYNNQAELDLGEGRASGYRQRQVKLSAESADDRNEKGQV